MKIIYDKVMPLGHELFSRLSPDVTGLSADEITPEVVRDADLLFCRSTLKVNAALLDGSSVRFVGSGVVGTDHIDSSYLETRGITWVSAPGCNAESVADYFVTSLLLLAEARGFELRGKTLGVVGVGQVGSRVFRRAQALGMNVLGCDPFLMGYLSLEELLPQCDIITFHTPLTHDGPYPTFHMLTGKMIQRVKPGAILVNMARGDLVDAALLTTAVDQGFFSDLLLDVWEGEPDYSSELAMRAFGATPHIAGHAYEGKVNGTIQVYHSACDYLGVAPSQIPELPPPPVPTLTLDAAGRSDEAVLLEACRTICDVEGDTRRFRQAYDEIPARRKTNFKTLRANYPMRRQFNATQLTLLNATPVLRTMATGIGLTLQ